MLPRSEIAFWSDVATAVGTVGATTFAAIEVARSSRERRRAAQWQLVRSIYRPLKDELHWARTGRYLRERGPERVARQALAEDPSLKTLVPRELRHATDAFYFALDKALPLGPIVSDQVGRVVQQRIGQRYSGPPRLLLFAGSVLVEETRFEELWLLSMRTSGWTQLNQILNSARLELRLRAGTDIEDPQQIVSVEQDVHTMLNASLEARNLRGWHESVVKAAANVNRIIEKRARHAV